MASKLPPPAVVTVTEKARSGLDALKRSLVPPPIALLDFISDFWAFHIVYALAELDVPDALRAAPRSSDTLSAELKLDADMLYRVLRAASMLGVCEEQEGRVFALKGIGHALCRDEQASFRDFVVFQGRHGTRLWKRLADCVRTGKSAVELETGKVAFDYLVSDPEVSDDFNRAMTATSNMSCDAFVAAYDMSFASKVVDVGGGRGRLLAGLLRQYPQLHGVLYDLPSVVAGAPELMRSFGVAERAEIVSGNFFESVPAGADCYVAKSVIHDWSDDDARKILRNIRTALAPNGRALLFETVVGPRNAASFSKFLDLEMIVATDGGRERSADEFRALFSSAGLEMGRVVATAGPLSIIEAFPV
jgi:SAM-dependent methyltransferase